NSWPCPRNVFEGELLKNTRHHKVHSCIATHLCKANWVVYEEVHCTLEDGSHRRANIVAINRQAGRGLESTIRMEQDGEQAIHVNTEKEMNYHHASLTSMRDITFV
ncbi:hypothetical protein C0J52_20068, partial [Blattella germanica]